MITTFVVAVTGGIGSGKSTVSALFEQRHGAAVIDADLIAREVVEPGAPALDELVAHFGRDILDARGGLDRRKLKHIVFADAEARATLESMLHPRIRARMRAALERVRTPYCLLGIPLLAEGGRNDLVDRVLVVDCPETTQIARVTARDDLTEQDVMAIMRSQASRDQRLAIADDVIVNDGDREALIASVDRLHETYSRLARDHHPRRTADEH